MKARLAALVLFLTACALAVACEKAPPTTALVPNERPTIQLSTAPQVGDSVFYLVRFTWFSYDSDGQVVSFRYAIDPPISGDTAWIETREHSLEAKFQSRTPGGGSPTGIAGSDYHVFLIEAIDDRGLSSLPESDAFTSYTVAPTARLTFPSPSHQITASTPGSVLIQWTGVDPDGPGDKRPPKYKFKLAEQSVIQSTLGIGSVTPTATDIQKFFGDDAPEFAGWDSSGADTTAKQYNGLTGGTVYYFAVIALDEVGAYDPRMDLDRNVIRFRPSNELLAPKLTVYNDLFSASASSMDLSPERITPVTVPTGEVITLNWSATAAAGAQVVGYRWVLDPANGDLGDETPRADDTQTYRWSAWALVEQSTTVGPYSSEVPHYFYVEARDNSGAQSLVQVRIDVVTRTNAFLVIDDYQAGPDFNYGPTSAFSYQPYGNFPTEAVLDTLMYAVGGKPYKFRPPGTLSVPGVFAGFDYDTLDYRFRRTSGLPVDVLFRYSAVVLYTTQKDATSSVGALSGLRFSAWRQTPNPLAVYVSHGGKLWLFGDGVLYAFMLRPGDQVFGMSRTPSPGSFPYDYMKLRSTFGIGLGSSPSPRDYMVGATPNLPDNATPGRKWPPDSTQAITRGTCDDPRVGPASFRNKARWAGLPCLSMTTEFQNWPAGFPAGVKGITFTAFPNSILEDVDPTSGVRLGSALDTLYLWRAADYIPGARSTNADGKPVMCAYEGFDSGPIVWTGMPLWFFDRQQVQVLADKVMGSFGFQRNPNPAMWKGPGSAQALDEEPELSANARASARTRRDR